MVKTVDKFIADHPSFTTGEFADVLRSEMPGVGRSTIFYLLKKKCESGEISKSGKGRYTRLLKAEYSHELSDTAKEIVSLIRQEYPLVSFQVWELYQMNEFVNHLMARNTIFIEVENMLEESIFNLLFDKYPHVLFNPDIEEYYKYAREETIVIRRLISEAPSPYGEYMQSSLEKILVDLFGRGLSGSIISRSEYPAIFEDSFKKYNINKAKLFRYARRRGVEQAIRDFIREKTNIILEEAR